MKILSVNAGSSSVKFQLFEMPDERVLVSAYYERIGLDNSFCTIKYNGDRIVKQIPLNDHSDAVKLFLKELVAQKIINKLEEIKGVGHRVVHGGDKYSSSVVINDEVVSDIKSYISLAPLHNPGNLLGINVAISVLPNIINVAVFDTAFHQTISKEQYIYPTVYDWYTKYKLRKYGFHGISHKYLMHKANEMLKSNNLKIISCHIGNGVSVSAIKDNKSVANSFGFTPTSGTMMGTRCGDIDPSVIPYIMNEAKMTIEEVMRELNANSGLLGVSGISSDARDIKAGIDRNDSRCILANNMFIERIVSYISYYYVLLGGADVIIFSGGIGENMKTTRESIINKLECLGIYINNEANNVMGETRKISSENSKVLCYVIPTNEELMIAKETYDLIER